jgi:hypothetical protein
MMQEFAENAQYLSALSAISVEPLQIHLDQQMRMLPLPNAQPRSTALPQTAETFASLVNEPMGLTLFRFHLRQIQSLEYLSFLHEVEVSFDFFWFLSTDSYLTFFHYYFFRRMKATPRVPTATRWLFIFTKHTLLRLLVFLSAFLH